METLEQGCMYLIHKYAPENETRVLISELKTNQGAVIQKILDFDLNHEDKLYVIQLLT